MSTATKRPTFAARGRIDINGREFQENKRAIYEWLREEAPVYRARVNIYNAFVLSRHEDCVNILKAPHVIRNRTTATGGGGRMPFPTPSSVKVLLNSMIFEDGADHRRLRDLVHRAFTPGALRKLEQRLQTITHELLDQLPQSGVVDLKSTYARPIPVTMIAEMVGVPDVYMVRFKKNMDSLMSGLGTLRMVKLMVWDIWRTIAFLRELVDYKRRHLGDDILSALIQAESDGDRLNEDELVSMVFLLIGAGFETTVHLITNAIVTLLTHPDQLEKLRNHPELMESAVEEVLRYNGPVHGTKPNYTTVPITLHGTTIPQGGMIMPLLGAANLDPRAFTDPEVFDIERRPNQHLGFGKGIHYCLGAPLARMETKIALENLLARYPDLRLALPAEDLVVGSVPLLHTYESLPVELT
jgi:cytochrome P450